MTERVLARASTLTGAQLDHILRVLDVPASKLAADGGWNSDTVYDWLSGKLDGKIPVAVEWILLGYDRDVKLRSRTAPLFLPLDRWLSVEAPQRRGSRGRPRRQRASITADVSAEALA